MERKSNKNGAKMVFCQQPETSKGSRSVYEQINQSINQLYVIETSLHRPDANKSVKILNPDPLIIAGLLLLDS